MKKGLGKTMRTLYKSYLFTVAAKELKKLADIDYGKELNKAWKRLDFDKVGMLHKVGLAPYKPGRAAMGSGVMFLLGAGVGAVAAMVLTPVKGEEFRQNLKGKATQMMAKQDLGQTQAPAEA